MFLGLSHSEWQFINTFAPWLSAIGTLSAVLLSLYVAFRRPRPRAKLTASVYMMVEAGSAPPFPDFVHIKVVNTGDRPFKITAIGWTCGMFNKRAALQNTDGLPNSSSLPIVLEHGQEAIYLVPFAFAGESWPKYFARGVLMPRWRLALWSLRSTAYTSTGSVFKAKPDQSLRKALEKACQSLKGDSPPQLKQ